MTENKGQVNPSFVTDEKTHTSNPVVTENDIELVHMTALNVEPVNGHVVEDDEYVPKKVEFDPKEQSAFARATMSVQDGIKKAYTKNKTIICPVIGIILLLLYLAYFSYAMHYRFGDEGSIRLLVCTVIGITILVLYLLRHLLAFITDFINDFLTNVRYYNIHRIIRIMLYVASVVVIVTLIIVLVALDTPRNLISLAGLAAFIILCFVTSHNPAMIRWHPVFWGFSLQFYFAVIILKTRWGYDAFQWLGDRVTEFLAYSDEGAKFVFSDFASITTLSGESFKFLNAYQLHFFAFKIMPVITFFSTIISVLYYLGVMQKIITILGRFLAFCLGTTPAESLNAAGNIFVAMTESPLMIRPFIPKMTSSELHAVMTGGFATIAGSVLGAYIGFGVPAEHLLSASVMSAPAALAISKITYPEDEIPITSEEDYKKMEKTTESSVIEAACNGAAVSAKIIASVVVNVIAFLSLLKFVNATLTWFGDRAGVENLTFELICSYILYPVALFMGTEPEDCRKVAELVGVKTFTNEFIAYERLAGLLANKKTLNAFNGTWQWDCDDIILNDAAGTVLKNGVISSRSEVIATYALCGFSNFGSMGILLGGLSAMAPKRRTDMSKIIFRAMLAGNVACFFTACIAGLFYEEFN